MGCVTQLIGLLVAGILYFFNTGARVTIAMTSRLP